MTARSSEVFSFLEKHPQCSLERVEVWCPAFAELRSASTEIVGFLKEGEPGALAIADAIRRAVAEWLTVPVVFNVSLRAPLELLGAASSTANRWGRGVADARRRAEAALEELVHDESSLRKELGLRLKALDSEGAEFRIWCYRSAQSQFESLLPTCGWQLFLHSEPEYRDSSPFDVLVKVGPLRSRGWGRLPDAVCSAPRFHTLVQFVWAPSRDDEGFGYDPAVVVGTPNTMETMHRNGTIRWEKQTRSVGQAGNRPPEWAFASEEQLFYRVRKDNSARPAMFLEVDDEHGILVPRSARLLSYDRADIEQPIHHRTGDELVRGMYLLLPVIDEPDFGGHRTLDTASSRAWRERLRQEYVRDEYRLARQLRNAGLTLVSLESQVEHWLKPPSTVIHAPQRRAHFEMLLRVLGFGVEGPNGGNAWIRRAWLDVMESRGKAIQTGMQGSEIVEDELIAALMTCIDQIRDGSEAESRFDIQLPARRSLTGLVQFWRVNAVEDGFAAPYEECWKLIPLAAADEWRD